MIEFGSIFLNSKRDLDICARYGGEEFVILLPHTDINEAQIIAERYRITIEQTFKESLGLTVSIGISNCPKTATDLNTIIKKADQALYKSKKFRKKPDNIKLIFFISCFL